MTITHKRGTTFRVPLPMSEDSPLTGATVTATIRCGAWSADLACRVLDDDPRVVELSAADTTAWPLALLAGDVRAVRDGEIVATETYHINCIAEVTR